jgi:hypothetical protein
MFRIAYRPHLREKNVPNPLTFEDGTEQLSRNVGNQLPIYDAQQPREAKNSSAPCRKPEILHRGATFLKIPSIDKTKTFRNILC